MASPRSFILAVRRDFASRVHHKKTFITSQVFLFLTIIVTTFHYSNILYGNNFTWLLWLISLALLFVSFVSPRINLSKSTAKIDAKVLVILLGITAVYWVSHLWNFNSAPWNTFGLFDDAAWDIYFSVDKIFTELPFQPVFFDQVGLVARETVFHYYITAFFKLFGYNLLSFNFSLLVLGYITMLFTSLIVQKLFGRLSITFLMALTINFLPFHYMHVFMGHRYAIAAPLMTISLYFLYSAFKDDSALKSSLSAFFAALCWGSAIMGKQYILGLVVAAVATLLCNHRAVKPKKNISLSLAWIVAFLFSATPLILYIVFNTGDYFNRESGLFRQVLTTYSQSGASAFEPYYMQVKDLFFAEVTFSRQFLHDRPLLPVPYYFLLLPGLALAFTKKRFEIVLLSLIPVLSVFLSGAYDFRVLIAAPIWIIAMAFSLDYIFRIKRKGLRQLLIALSGAILLIVIIPSSSYIYKVSKDPNYQYLLPHKDVAASRIFQDIVLGDVSPSIEMKHNEFRRNCSNCTDGVYVHS